MRSTRLNQEIREAIQRILMKGRFTEALEKLDQQTSNLAFGIYKALLGKEFEAVQTAPKHWFFQKGHLEVQFGGKYAHLSFGPNQVHSIPANLTGTSAHYVPGDRFSKQWDKICLSRQEIRIEEVRLKREIRSILASASTIKRLCEIWPEIRQVAEKFSQENAPALPVVQTRVLSKKLGLCK